MPKVTETNKESIFSLSNESCNSMPGDSLITTHKGDTVRLADTLFQSISPSMEHALDRSGEPVGDGSFWLGITIVICVVVSRPFLLKLWKKTQLKKLQKEALEELNSNYAQFDSWLSVYNSYYSSLSIPIRRRFLERTVEFMESKKFTYVDLVPEAKMPLLVSAAAIQLTFGLNKYTLDFFDTIHLLKTDYRFGLYNVPFAGHVSSNGIYLSWDNFLRGYANDSDADNVGVHEMAHALAYVNFMAGPNGGQDSVFQAEFKRFSKVAKPIFNEMLAGTANMLSSYAATNYDEFWAVAVENFFEKFQQMNDQMPVLFQAMCRLLNQNPLRPDKILNV